MGINTPHFASANEKKKMLQNTKRHLFLPEEKKTTTRTDTRTLFRAHGSHDHQRNNHVAASSSMCSGIELTDRETDRCGL